MEDKDFKIKIKKTAVDNFDKVGYHGATIRKIANDVGCSIPMIYYYYKSKKELFHEIIKKDYFKILSCQAEKLKAENIIDFYTEFVYGLNNLSSYDKKIYRLGIKVYLSFDGDEELTNILEKWEQSIVGRHSQLIFPHLKNQENGNATVRTLIHLLENLIESIVVKNKFISKNEIHDELSVVLDGRLKD